MPKKNDFLSKNVYVYDPVGWCSDLALLCICDFEGL